MTYRERSPMELALMGASDLAAHVRACHYAHITEVLRLGREHSSDASRSMLAAIAELEARAR